MTASETSRRNLLLLGLTIVMLGVFSLATPLYYAGQQRDCLIKVVGQQNDVIVAGREANRTETDATGVLLTDALNGKIKTPKELAAAKKAYETARAIAAQKRAASPIPPDPREVC